MTDFKKYQVEAACWEDSITRIFFAPNKESAFKAVFKEISRTHPGFDIVRLWGEGKLLWTIDEGWLREHEAF